jgi:hypothetical protein
VWEILIIVSWGNPSYESCDSLAQRGLIRGRCAEGAVYTRILSQRRKERKHRGAECSLYT